VTQSVKSTVILSGWLTCKAMKYLNNEALVASKNIAVVTSQHLDPQLRKTGKFIAAAFSAETINGETHLFSLLAVSEPCPHRRTAWYQVMKGVS